MSIVGAASFDINANPAKAIAALKQLQKEALASTGLVLTPTVDAKGVKAKLKAALDGIVGTLNAEVKIKPPTKTQVTAALSSIVATLQAEVKIKPPTAAQVRAALSGTPASATVNINLNEASVTQKIDRIKTALQDLRVSTGGLFRIDADALKALATQISQQITDLRAIESSLRTLQGRNNGGGGAGTGGGGPGTGAATNPYAAQLRALQGDLKSSALSTDQYRAAVANLQAALNGEMNALRGLGVLTVSQQRQLDGLRTTSGQAAAALKGLTDQETRLNAAAQQGGVAKIGRELALANSKFETGSLGLRDYLRELQRLETSARTLAPSLAADSKAALDLQRVMQGLGGAKADLNTQSIKNVRIELSQARTAYEQALAAAGSSWRAQGQAATAYQQVLKGVDASLAGVARRASLTREQALSVANIQRQLAGQQNALQGTVSPLGISGAFLNALRGIPALAQAAGGSLGAAAGMGQQLGGALGQMTAQIGPLGIAIGVLVVSLAALVSEFTNAFKSAANFQQALQEVKALTQPTADQLAALRQGAMDIGTPLGVGATEATKAILELNRAGLSAADAIGGGLAGALTLAGASGVTAATGGRLAVAAMTAFELQAKDLPGVADTYANFANKTFLGAEDLQNALAAVGPVAKQAGLNFNEFSGYMATLAQGGFKRMTDAGTSLKTSLLSLLAPADTAEKALARIKLETYDGQGNFKGFAVILDELGSKLNKLSQQDRNRALKEIFGTDGVRAGTILLAKGNRAIQDNIDAMGLQGEAARVARERLESYQGQVSILKATFESFQISVGEKFLPVMTRLATGLTTFFDQVQRGGPLLDEIKGNVYALATAILFLKAELIVTSVSGAWTALAARIATLGGLSGIFTTLGASLAAFGSRLASAASAGLAFGGLRGALSGIAGVLRSVTFAAGGVTAGLTLAVGAALALAVAVNKILADTAKIYDQADQGDQKSFETVMARVAALRAQNTELSRAQAKYLLLTQQLADAQQGPIVGVTAFGERIYGPRDEAQIAKLQAALKDVGQSITVLRTEDVRRAAAAKAAGQSVDASLHLTLEQLEKQKDAIRSVREELSKRVVVFGGTDFQNQLKQIDDAYTALRIKLKATVKDPVKLQTVLGEIDGRRALETTATRGEFQGKAAAVAAEGERAAAQARIAAMADGTAKIKAQASFDIAELRRIAKQQANEQRDFPLEAARITAAAESRALEVRKEASRKVAEFEKEEAKKREAEVKRRDAAIRKAQQDVARGAALQRQLSNLNTNVGAKVDSGKLTASGFTSFTQQLDGLKAKIKGLPVPLQAAFAGLLKQSDALTISGKKAADYNAELKNLKGSLKNMGYDELLAAQKRVADDLSRQRSLDLINKEIQVRQKLIKTQADQQLGAGREQLKTQASQATISGYDDEKTRVQGRENTAQLLLEIEQRLGAQVLAARQQLAQASAEKDIRETTETYRKQLDLAHGNDAKILQLTTQRDALIVQRRVQRNAEQTRNAEQSGRDLVTAGEAAESELLKAVGQAAAGRGAIRTGEAQATLDEYERRKEAAQGSATKLLSLELEMGSKVLAARAALVQESARADIQGINESYQTRIEAAKGNATEIARLEDERDQLIAQRRAQRNGQFALLAQQRTASDVEAQQAATRESLKLEGEIAAGRAALRTGDAQATLDEYARRQDAAHGNADQLLKIELEMGDRVLAARAVQAQASAETDIQGIKEKYQTRIEAAKGNATEIARLEDERDKLILQRRAQRNGEFKLLAQQRSRADIEAQRAATLALLQLSAERQGGKDAVLSGSAQADIDGYGLRQAAARDNVVKLLSIEQELGAKVLAARIIQGSAQANADISQLRSSYQTRIDAAENDAGEVLRLEGERDALILQRRGQQSTAELLLAQQSGQALIDARKKVTDALLALDQSLFSGLAERASTEAGRKKDQFERDLANDLSDLGDNERAKYDLLRSSQTTRIALAQRAVTAQEQADTLAENQRFENERDRLTQAGLYDSRRLQLEADHQTRLTAISTKGIQDRSSVEEDLVRAATAQLGKANEVEVKQQIDALTRNLSAMTGLQRESARSSLLGWLDTFQKAGVAGQAAVKLIQDALLGVANADTDARTKAAELLDRDKDGRFVSAGTDQSGFSARLGKIGKPENQQDAISKGTGQYAAEVTRLEDKIRKAGAALLDFQKGAKLTADQQQVFDLLSEFLPQWKAQLATARQTATDAGQKAGAAYIKGFTDLIVNPATSGVDFARQLGKIGKPEGADDVRLKAEAQFDSLRDVYQSAIKELNTKLDGLDRPDLSPDEQRAKTGLQATLTLYQRFLTQIGQAAKTAGVEAGAAYVKGLTDAVVDPTKTQADFARKLGAVGKPETADDARSKAEAQFDSLKGFYDDAIKDLSTKLAGLDRPDLTPDEKKAKTGLQATLDLYKGFIPQIVSAASSAGAQAATAFTASERDKAAEGTLALASAARELAIANAETLPADQQPTALAAISATYQKALTIYRDYWNERLKLAQAGNAAGTVTEAELTEVSNKAAAAQKGLTGEVVSQNNTLDASNKKTGDGISALRQAREAYDSVLGLSAPAYQSEIDALQKLKLENSGLADQIDALIGKYQQLQNARKGITVEGVRLDFQAGQNKGTQDFQGSVSGVAQALGGLTNPLGILAAILEKINPVGEILAGMFEVLEEPLKALQEPFRLIGQVLASEIAPILELIAPILEVLAQLYAALYDAIAAFIKAITFGLVNIDRRTPEADKQKDRDTQNLKSQNDLDDLDRQYRDGKLAFEDYQNAKLAATRARIERERQLELDGAKGNAGRIREINRKFDTQQADARKATLKETSDYATQLAGSEADIADEALTNSYRRGEITKKQYEQKQYEATILRLHRERDAKIAAAEGDAKKIEQINREYVQKEETARLDMLDRVSAAYTQITDNLGSTVLGGIGTSLLNAAKAGNFGQFRTEFRKNLREAMFQAVLSAAIESAAFGALLQPAIDALKAAFLTDGTADDDAAIQGLLKAGDAVEGKAKQIYKALKPLRDRWGIGEDSSQPQQIEVVGNISTPEVKVSLDMLSYLADTIKQSIPAWRDAIIAHTPALSADTATLLLHAPALAANTLAMPTFVSAVSTFGLHTTSLSGTAMLYSTTTDRFVQGVNLWANASAAHIGAMNAHTAALRGDGSAGGTRKYQGG